MVVDVLALRPPIAGGENDYRTQPSPARLHCITQRIVDWRQFGIEKIVAEETLKTPTVVDHIDSLDALINVIELLHAAAGAKSDAIANQRRFGCHAGTADCIVERGGYHTRDRCAVPIRWVARIGVRVQADRVVIEIQCVVGGQIRMRVVKAVVDHRDKHARAAIVIPDLDDVGAFYCSARIQKMPMADQQGITEDRAGLQVGKGCC